MIVVQMKNTKSRNRFLITCNFADNDLVKNLPNRRFNKRLRAWEAPTVARNAESLLELKKQGKAAIDADAVEACKQVLEAKARRSSERFPAWYPFKTKPRDKQMEALNYIWGVPNPGLFCEMGTGKSKMIIDWASARIMSGAVSDVVIFCPIAIRDNWLAEIDIHCPISDAVVAKVDTSSSKAVREVKEFTDDSDSPPRFLICGIESLQQKHQSGKAYDLVMDFVLSASNRTGYLAAVDESHYIQNCETVRWSNINDLSVAAKQRLIATGTETDGRPTDLFGQFEYLDPNILGFGDFYSFRCRYEVKGGFENKQVIGYQNVDELVSIIAPHVFQAQLKDVADIPPAIHMPPRMVKLTKDQERMIKEIKRDGETKLAGQEDTEIVTEGVLAVYTAIQQICSGHVSRFTTEFTVHGEEKRTRTVEGVVSPSHNPKISELLQVTQEIGARSKTLIWCKYRAEIADVVEALQQKYGPESVFQYHGGMTPEERKASSDTFKKSGKAKFLVLMTSVGGTGLTFNEALYSIYMSNSFKLRERLQSQARNYRIGQTDHVTYIDIVADTMVEKGIMAAIRDKKDLATYIKQRLEKGIKINELL